ncbi:MAG: Tetratricopeptide repeat containig protein [Promethearchaeota archaeon]|nr:MAG: Tetratricopeptide repeat containig protein [Candidatus Lokiarchaeota archaeon]
MTDLKAQLEKAISLRKEEEYEQAIKLLENLYGNYPEDESVKKRLVDTLIQYAGNLNDEFVREYNKALEILLNALDIDPKNYRAFYNLGITYHNLGKNEDALDALNKALEIKSDYKYCYYNLGLIYEDMNEFMKALKAYTKATEIDKDFRYAEQAKKDMQKIVESLDASEIPIIDRIETDSREKLKNLLKMSKTIKLDILEEVLNIDKPIIIDLIIEWGEKYHFRLDGEYLIINKDTLPELLKELE